jgi:hypothetical protein
VIAANVDCKRLAIAAQIYRANEEGIFEIAKRLGSTLIKVKTPNRASLISPRIGKGSRGLVTSLSISSLSTCCR